MGREPGNETMGARPSIRRKKTSRTQNGQSSQTQHARCIRRPFRACKRCVRIHECCIHRVRKCSEFAMQSLETNDVFADRSEFANAAFADRGVHERNFHRVRKC